LSGHRELYSSYRRTGHRIPVDTQTAHMSESPLPDVNKYCTVSSELLTIPCCRKNDDISNGSRRVDNHTDNSHTHKPCTNRHYWKQYHLRYAIDARVVNVFTIFTTLRQNFTLCNFLTLINAKLPHDIPDSVDRLYSSVYGYLKQTVLGDDVHHGA